MKLLPVLLFTATLCAQTWTPQTSNTRASLRGVSAVDARTVFASGSGGTWLATTDGGDTWRAAKVPGAESLDFRGIHAIDARTVYLMSAGAATNPVSTRPLTPASTGRSCSPIPSPRASSTPSPSGMRSTASSSATSWTATPKCSSPMTGAPHGSSALLLPAFPTRAPSPPATVASRSSAANDAWFATGGPGAARVFHTADRGRTWTVAVDANSQRWRRRRHLLARLRRRTQRHRRGRRLLQR